MFRPSNTLETKNALNMSEQKRPHAVPPGRFYGPQFVGPPASRPYRTTPQQVETIDEHDGDADVSRPAPKRLKLGHAEAKQKWSHKPEHDGLGCFLRDGRGKRSVATSMKDRNGRESMGTSSRTKIGDFPTLHLQAMAVGERLLPGRDILLQYDPSSMTFRASQQGKPVLEVSCQEVKVMAVSFLEGGFRDNLLQSAVP